MNYDIYSPFTAPTSEEIALADEKADIERADGMFQVLKWAIAVVAVFGCMLVEWYAS